MRKKASINMTEFHSDNIVAPATPIGAGAIGIIRLSGADSITIADSVFSPYRKTSKNKASLKGTDSYKLIFGKITETASLDKSTPKGRGKVKDEKSLEEKFIDECLAAVFRAPNSYTGENCVEIYCHASSYIMSKIQILLIDSAKKLFKERKIASPLRVADAGEFTKRAFLNGKMDLTQAEAVADLIASETEASHNIAINQMRGGFSNELRNLRQQLLSLCSLMELELDFSEEDVEFASRQKLANLLSDTYLKIKDLAESFALGNVIKNGIPVAIVGAVNTGKSTLLNLILGEERAIVSPIQGTTRDTIEDTINIGGTMFRFIDTAGIRSTRQTIEMMGIERTWQKLKESSIIILMLDSTREETFQPSIESIAEKIDHKRQKLIIIANKLDKISAIAEKTDKRRFRTSVLTDKEDEGSTGNENSEKGRLKTNAFDIKQKQGSTIAQNADKRRLNTSAFASKGTGIYTFYSEETNTQADISKKIKAICKKQKLNDVKTFAFSFKADPLSPRKKVENTLSDIGNSFTSNIQGKTYVTNMRHYQALKDATASIERVFDGIDSNLPTDLLAQDLREATDNLGSIIGEISSQDILSHIFSHFCIGK